MLIPFNEILFPLLILLIAYIIFGISGFGTALISAPLLAFYMPVAKIIPLLALLDFLAALLTFLHDRKDVCWQELKRLVPLMIIGSLIGVAILLYLHPEILLPILGFFVVGYSLYALSGLKIARSFSKTASIPFGLIGGVFSALFGSGGFVYAIYLMGRLDDKTRAFGLPKAF